MMEGIEWGSGSRDNPFKARGSQGWIPEAWRLGKDFQPKVEEGNWNKKKSFSNRTIVRNNSLVLYFLSLSFSWGRRGLLDQEMRLERTVNETGNVKKQIFSRWEFVSHWAKEKQTRGCIHIWVDMGTGNTILFYFTHWHGRVRIRR